MPTRRDLLKSVAATLTAWLLPHRLFATTADPSFHFIHADSCNSWPITDPVAWALQNQHEPILERAATGLVKLTENDGDRIIRLVVRRCGLNLIELHPGMVIVHHWGQHHADLRPFFKTLRLARPEIAVDSGTARRKPPPRSPATRSCTAHGSPPISTSISSRASSPTASSTRPTTGKRLPYRVPASPGRVSRTIISCGRR